MTNAQLQSR